MGHARAKLTVAGHQLLVARIAAGYTVARPGRIRARLCNAPFPMNGKRDCELAARQSA